MAYLVYNNLILPFDAIGVFGLNLTLVNPNEVQVEVFYTFFAEGTFTLLSVRLKNGHRYW